MESVKLGNENLGRVRNFRERKEEEEKSEREFFFPHQHKPVDEKKKNFNVL